MKVLPEGLQAHLDGGATTLCHCWRVERRDGAVFGFTDHDRALTFGGVIYAPESGFTATESVSSLGLAVDGLEIEGGLSSDAISEEDIALGFWDNSAIELYRVNWSNVAQRVILRAGSLGEIVRGALDFTAEIRSLAHRLNHASGRTYTRICDAVVGDGKCRAPLDHATYRGHGVVGAATDDRIMRVNGLSVYAAAWFSGGVLTWTGGANHGVRAIVSGHVVDPGGGVRLTLWERAALAVDAGDTFAVTAGCDKTFATCKAKFANGLNFRGFPHMPGNDFAMSLAKRTTENDGGSFFSG